MKEELMNQEPPPFYLQKQLNLIATFRGQFEMADGGQFTLEKRGQFTLVSGGQFDWIFQHNMLLGYGSQSNASNYQVGGRNS